MISVVELTRELSRPVSTIYMWIKSLDIRTQSGPNNGSSSRDVLVHISDTDADLLRLKSAESARKPHRKEAPMRGEPLVPTWLDFEQTARKLVAICKVLHIDTVEFTGGKFTYAMNKEGEVKL